MTNNAPLYQITFFLDPNLSEEQAGQIGDFMEDLGDALTLRRDQDSTDWQLQIIAQSQPNPENINKRIKIANDVFQSMFDLGKGISFKSEQLEDIDWLAKNYEAFQPIIVEPFYIYGSHHDANDCPSKDLIPIEINAANAFGTGEHPTTKGCLKALGYLRDNGYTPNNILDLGCGSGILSIAARKLWPEVKIMGSDLDEDSVLIARNYSNRNGIDDIQFELATGYEHEDIKNRAPYDLILANILAGPLIDLAKDTAKHLDEGGMVLLSGTLLEQEDSVRKAHEDQGLVFDQFFHEKEKNGQDWTSFFMIKKA